MFSFRSALLNTAVDLRWKYPQWSTVVLTSRIPTWTCQGAGILWFASLSTGRFYCGFLSSSWRSKKEAWCCCQQGRHTTSSHHIHCKFVLHLPLPVKCWLLEIYFGDKTLLYICPWKHVWRLFVDSLKGPRDCCSLSTLQTCIIVKSDELMCRKLSS